MYLCATLVLFPEIYARVFTFSYTLIVKYTKRYTPDR